MDNPFDDIVPRITAEEKRAQQRAREQVQKEREETQRRKGVKKWEFAVQLPAVGASPNCQFQEHKTSQFRG